MNPDVETLLGSEELDLGFDIDQGIQTQIDADRTMYVIGRLNHDIAREEQCLEEAIAFYKKRIQAIEKQQEFLKGKLRGFLDNLELNGLDPKAATPNGTAFLQTRKLKKWNDENLVDFARKHDWPDIIKTEYKVSKPDIEKKCEADDVKPPYSVHEEKSLVIRQPKKKE